jgi:hypothetical protein
LESEKENSKTSPFSFIKKLFIKNEYIEIYSHEKEPTVEDYIENQYKNNYNIRKSCLIILSDFTYHK